LNGALNTSSITSSNFTQGLLINVANISNALLAVGQNWTLECQANDSMATSSRLNSTTITIQALTPSTPTLISPTNNNYSLITRQPTFNWTTSSYATWYEINITSNTVAPPPLGNTTNIYYTPSSELYLDIEPGQGLSTYYNWTVRACNVQNCSPWANKWNFSIMEYLAISMPSNTVSYPSIQPGTTEDTVDMSPTPITIRNDGNVRANLTSITFNQTSLWLSGGAGLGTRYFQIKARQGEAGSFNTTGSIMGWTNASQSVNNVIGGLEYNNSKDEAYLDTLIEAPSQEPFGNRSISISFNWITHIPN
jgi:hypothetical protein